ncbi:MAG: glutamine-hydrolyzing carbamoyl-phosphate synthase small subunit [Actinomycetota bacterium]|nr:glutamine-hydrolyzing carbamoyl-phosphate synthase small subunit [Actinomycetota bacterium]
MSGTPAKALVVLEDGSAFRGSSFGAEGTSFGEAVFNTGMAGYQEILTDPSYRGQIVVMTATHVGNYGMNPADAESDRIQVAGFVVREAARRPSSWRARGDLGSALREAGIVGVEGVDTRRLTRLIREQGAMRCGVSTEILDVDALHAQVLESPGMVGRDLTREVTTSAPYTLEGDVGARGRRHRAVALDFGVKRSILGNLARQGFEVVVLPAHASDEEVLAYGPDGVFVSNGPGDPAAVTGGIATVRHLLGKVPVFGICLGSQLLGHALGAETYKLRFGHRGTNQPVLRRADGAVEITSHNHGFAVEAASLGEQIGDHRFETVAHGQVEVSHLNLNDGTCEGLVCLDVPAFSVQYHPEAAPGPHDAEYLFERFSRLVEGAGQVGRHSGARPDRRSRTTGRAGDDRGGAVVEREKG